MKTLSDLIHHLVASGVLKTDRIISAFENIDRRDFVLSEHRSTCYGDYPLPIYAGQTISQPTTVAIMLELLQPGVGEYVLDVGSGSGWTTALLAYIVGTEGRVWGVERHETLVNFGKANLAKYDYPHAEIISAQTTLGLLDEALFDRILVSAASKTLPIPLLEQLKTGGRMVIPIQNDVVVADKKEGGSVHTRNIHGFVFVPLIE